MTARRDPTSRVRRIATNVGWLTVARGAQAGLALVSSVILSRALGPSGFGTLGFGLALVTYFVYVVNLGFDTLGAREVAKDTGRLGDLAGHILTLRVGLGLVALALYIAVVAWLPRPPTEAVALAILGLAIPAQAFSTEWAFHGTERMHEVAVYVVGVAVLQVLGYLLTVRGPEDLVTAAAIQGGALVVGTGWLWVRHRLSFGQIRPLLNRPEQTRLLRLSLPIATSSFMIAVYYNIDKVMLGVVRDDAEVGLYEAAYKLLSAAIMPCIVLAQGFFPQLAAAHTGEGAALRHTSELFLRTLLAVGLPLVALAAVLGPSLILVFFGPDFQGSVAPFSILLINAAFVYLNTAYAQPLLAWNRQQAFMRAVMGGAAVNVALNLVLIPPLGSSGAAVATVVAEICVLSLVLRPHYTETGSLHLGAAVRPLLALLLGVGPALAAQSAWDLGPWTTSGIGALGYSAAAVALGVLPRSFAHRAA